MINKSKLWFLTISSLIMVLTIYYVAFPTDKIEEVFKNDNVESTITELDTTSETIMAMKIDNEESYSNELKVLQDLLLNKDSTTDQKNEAYNEIKYLNNKKAQEEKITKLIDDNFKISSFVSIKENDIKVTIDKKEVSYTLANDIIIFVHEKIGKEYYVTIKYE